MCPGRLRNVRKNAAWPSWDRQIGDICEATRTWSTALLGALRLLHSPATITGSNIILIVSLCASFDRTGLVWRALRSDFVTCQSKVSDYQHTYSRSPSKEVEKREKLIKIFGSYITNVRSICFVCGRFFSLRFDSIKPLHGPTRREK